MKKKSAKVAFYVMVIFFCLSPLAGAWSILGSGSDQDEKESKALRAIIALNYCHASLHKIIDYNDRIILDEQYSEIINNINLTKIDDEEVIELLEDLIHTLNKFKINEEEKKIFQKKYEKKMERAFYEAFSNPGPMFAGDPISAGVNAIVSIGSSYASYKKKQEEYREELDESMWEIKKDEMTMLTGMRADFLHAYWEIMRRRNIPDKRRLTEKQLTNYIAILKEEDKSRQYRKLGRIKDDFYAYPPFWYYYGKASYNVDNKKGSFVSYKTFEKVHQGFFREDAFYSSVLMNKIQLLDDKKNKKEILRSLAEISEFAPYDSRKRLFTAIKYYQLGKYDRAKNLLQANIDDNELVKLSTGILGQVYVAKNDPKGLEKILDKMLADDSHENYEILYLLGEMPEKRLIEKMRDQITGIEVKVDKDVVWDDISIHLPVKWAFESPEDLKISLRYSGKTAESKEFDIDKDNRKVVFNFGDKFDFDDFEKSNYNLKLEFVINHPFHKLKIVGNLKMKSVTEEKGFLGKSYNKVKSIVVDDEKISNFKERTKIVFETDYIATGKHKYVIKDDGKIEVI